MTRWLCALTLVLGCMISVGCTEEETKAPEKPVDTPATDAEGLKG